MKLHDVKLHCMNISSSKSTTDHFAPPWSTVELTVLQGYFMCTSTHTWGSRME